MPTAFTVKEDVALINIVRENPILYDAGHMNYTNVLMKDQKWNEIGQMLNKTSKECKHRWINIRDMYRKKFNDNTGETARCQYKYGNEMEFIIPFFKKTAAFATTVKEELPEQYTSNIEEGMQRHSDDQEIREPDVFGFLSQSLTTPDVTVSTDCTSSDVDIFLKSVGMTMKKLNPYYLNQAKTRIFHTVQEYELQQIMEQRGNPSEK